MDFSLDTSQSKIAENNLQLLANVSKHFSIPKQPHTRICSSTHAVVQKMYQSVLITALSTFSDIYKALGPNSNTFYWLT